MATVHHKVLDAIAGSPGAGEFMVVGADPEKDGDLYEKMSRGAYIAISNAKVFDYRSDQRLEATITEEESRMFAQGTIPMPFDVCWFEYETEQSSQLKRCYLAMRDPNDASRIMIMWFLWITLTGGRNVCMTDLEITSFAIGLNGDYIAIDTTQNFSMPWEVKEKLGDAFPGKEPPALAYNDVGMICIMLCSKTTEVVKVAEPTALNKKRAKAGKAPLKQHYVIDVIPREIRLLMRRDDAGGDGRESSHVRLHWRRSHMRRLGNGREVPVVRCLVGYRSIDDQDVVPTSYRISGRGMGFAIPADDPDEM